MPNDQTVVSSIFFGRQIRSTQQRVRRLYRKVQNAKRGESERLEELEAEARRCKEKLERLIDYAGRHKVMSDSDWNITNETLCDLNEAERILRQKGPLWKRILGWVEEAIRTLFDFLREIAPVVLPMLLNGVREPVLGLLVAFDVIKGLLPSADEDRF